MSNDVSTQYLKTRYKKALYIYMPLHFILFECLAVKIGKHPYKNDILKEIVKLQTTQKKSNILTLVKAANRIRDLAHRSFKRYLWNPEATSCKRIA